MRIKSLTNHNEFIMYKFPQGEYETINNQIARFVQALSELESSDYLNENEVSHMTNKGYNKFIRKRDSNNIDIGLYKLPSLCGLSSKDIEHLKNPAKPVQVTIIYHNDLDGMAAAAITNLIFNESLLSSKSKKIDFIFYNYNMKRITQHASDLKNNKMLKYTYKICIILDLNLTLVEINSLLNSYDKVLWIDHHQPSISTALNAYTSLNVSFDVLIDIRYSAAYLTYVLFKDLIKKENGIDILQTIPTIVSMMDTRMCFTSTPEFNKITLTRDLLSLLHGSTFKRYMNEKKSILDKNFHNDLIGKSIYVYNDSANSISKFPIGYTAGLDLNQFILDMNGFDPFSPIWVSILTNDTIVEDMINKGSMLSKLMMKKIAILWEEETVYYVEYNNHVVRCILSNNSTKFLASTERYNQSVKMIIKYKNAGELSIGVYSDDVYLKRANLAKVLKNIFNNVNESGGGHPGAAAITIQISNMEYLYNSLNGTYSTEVQKYCKDINEIYKTAKWKVDKNSYRYDETIDKAFILISSIILSKWDEYTLKDLSN